MRNHLNLKSVKINKSAQSNLTGLKEVTKFALPNIYLINARSLLSKVDELTATLNANSVNLVAVTETWLSEEMEDNLVSISGYNLFRKDRPCRHGGGVCAYLSEDILVKRHSDLEDDNFECMWLWLRPTRIPRPLSGIVICVVYHPPGLPEHEHSLLNEYLTNTTDTLCNLHPNCGLIFLGDFNDFEISKLLSRHNLEQVVQVPTRGPSTLDLIITNLTFTLLHK